MNSFHLEMLGNNVLDNELQVYYWPHASILLGEEARVEPKVHLH